jgi:hypothetical protein
MFFFKELLKIRWVFGVAALDDSLMRLSRNLLSLVICAHAIATQFTYTVRQLTPEKKHTRN